MTPLSQQQGAGQVLEALYTRYTDGSLTAEWLRRRSSARDASPSIASLRSAAHVADASPEALRGAPLLDSAPPGVVQHDEKRRHQRWPEASRKRARLSGRQT